MKKKKLIALIALIAVVVIACVVIGTGLADGSHTHSFGAWETLTAASCESAQIQVRRCECGEEETREGDPATGHDFVSISAESLLETPMASMVVTDGDLRVTGACVCGADVVITEGITIENAVLVLGENTVTVQYGALSTVLTIQAAELNMTLDGTVSDDTCVFSGSKDGEYSSKKEMGTKSDQYRIYYRVNISDILGNALFDANRDNAKVKLVLTVTSGSVAEDTAFTLKAYDPAMPETDAAFSDLTWNSVDSKENAAGAYAKLHWSNGTTLVSGGIGHNIAVENGQIVMTLAYSQIADFVDEDGNLLLAFAANTENLKVGALENKTESNRPTVQVVLNDAHFCVFDRENAQEQYFVSGSCTEQAKYLKSCACGAAGTETFKYGEVTGHTYSALVARKEKTCTQNGMKAHYRCLVCEKYFVDKNGEKVATSAASLKISAGHTYKLIQARAATCITEGNQKYYKCADCGKYFDAQKHETTKEAQKIPALGHSYSELIPQQDATCTEDGMKAHYRCQICGKYFVEKDGKKVATSAASLKIPAGHAYKVIAAKAATCTKDGNYKYYKCADCGKYFDAQKNETTKEAQKIPALGHDMVMTWDDTHHWSECANGCGETTEHEAHSGGTATETEQAKCEICGQPYGALKPAAVPDERQKMQRF